MSSSSKLVVCLGFPGLLAPRYLERLRAVDARVEPVALTVDPVEPVDPARSWQSAYPGEPHPEPPPWAEGVAEARRRVLADAEVLIALHTPADLMRHAPGLRWVQGIGAGVEQFAKAGVVRGQTIVTNAAGLGGPSIAEFVVGRLLQIWKRFREIEDNQNARRYVQAYGRTFNGSTVGIVGMGSIGCAIAERVRALGGRVLGMKRSEPSPEDRARADRFYRREELGAMLGECDAVVIAAPATPETHHLIDRQALAALREGAVLVNIARGSLLDEAALLEALASGHVSAAALDVFEEEPLPKDSPLWDAPNLYISAHSAVSVDRYMDDIFDLFEDNLRRYVAGEPLRNQVDMQLLGFG